MMDINPDILDEITRYVTDDLDPVAKSRIAEKIASDEVYGNHHAYYQTIIGALARDAAPNDTQGSIDSSEDDAYFDSLLNKDRKEVRVQRIAYLTGCLVLVAASFFLGRYSSPAPSSTSTNVPMANMEEEEEPLAAAGNALPITATIRNVRLASSQILLATHREPEVQYLFSNNLLRLFVPLAQQPEFASAQIELIALEQDKTVTNYLKINELLYSLEPNEEKQTLQTIEDEGIMQLLK